MPDEKEPTTKDLLEAMRIGFERVNANVDLMRDHLDGVEARVGSLEKWRVGNSDRVRKMVSEGDLTHDAKLSDEIVAREALAKRVEDLNAKQDTQLAILGRLERWAQRPMIRAIAHAVGVAILVWLATKGPH